MYIDKIIQVMKNDFPLFKNMELYEFYDQLSDDELNYILSGIFGEPVKKKGGSIYNQNGNQIYSEDSDGYWRKREYDDNGNGIYYESSSGWYKKEYDNNGRLIYYEDSDGIWKKFEYDDNGNEIYFEDSYGYWMKKEYNDIGRLIYRENSFGVEYDRRWKGLLKKY